MLLYIATRLPWGFRIMFPVKNNGVTWYIDVYFEDVCLNPFSFLFIEKYWYWIAIYRIHFPANISNSLQNRIICNNFQQKIASESIMKVYADSGDKFLKFKLLCDFF